MSTRINKNVGVIILSWNNADILDECFDSVAAQTWPGIRTVLVDNNSADDTVTRTKQNYPWVEIIESPSNGGFTAGNNLGIAHLLQDPAIEYILLLNSDARLTKDWVENTLRFAAYKPKGAMFQGTTLDYYDHEVIDSTHIYVAQNGQATQGSWRTLYQGEKGPNRVFGVNAAACMISRKFLDAQPFATFFDESFFMYLEDVDCCTRAVVMGWDNYYVPQAVAYHMGSASSGKNPGFSLYMTYRNNLAMLFKNFPASLFFRMLPHVVISDYRTVRGLLKDRRWKAAKSLLKGRFVGVFRVLLYTRQRRLLRAHSHVDAGQLWALMRKGY